jgi:transcriptional regulator of arginine metabolism
MEVMKQLRQQQIGQLIERRPIRTQHELATALREQGFRATQATVSRDIAELGLRKGLRDGLSVYVLPNDSAAAGASPATGRPTAEARDAAEERLRYLLANLPIDVRPAGDLLVVRTVPGSAHAIAAALDRVGWPGVAGSLAGDDTLFVAFDSRAALDEVASRLRRLARS